MKKSIAWVLTTIMMLALLTGCGSKSAKSDTEYVKKNGKLIVGITDYEPMDYKDENGEWTGFDAEFARMFAKELGVDCEFFVIADWGQKFFELDSKNIDAIWNGMTITDEVTLNTNCSNPYVVNAQVVIMKADVVGNYTSTDSLKDLTFAVESGSAGEDAVKDLGITEIGGVYVAGITEGGAASEAGIRKGDVILAIDGVKLDGSVSLQEQVARHRPNDKVRLSVKRDGSVKQIDVTLRNKAGKAELLTREDVDVVEALGGRFADAGSKLCRELDIRGGVQVVGLKADGLLSRARVKQGFVITHINDKPVYSVSEMQRLTEKIRSIDGVYPNGRSASYMFVE